MSSTRLPAISTTAVTIHPVPMDWTDGKVANEPSRVRVSVVEPSGTWTFGLGKNRDLVGPCGQQGEGRLRPLKRWLADGP